MAEKTVSSLVHDDKLEGGGLDVWLPRGKDIYSIAVQECLEVSISLTLKPLNL
jgi:hypothetical protein